MSVTLKTIRAAIRPRFHLWITRRHNHGDTNNQRSKYRKIDMENKVVVVTGGASGIGFHICKRLLEEGASCVTMVDKDKAKLEESSAKLIKDFGEECLLQMEADVSDIQQMDTVFRNTVLHYHTIDLIINNAGIMDDNCWETMIRTNLHGSVVGTLLGMQYMAKSSSGCGGTIVNVGSIMSVIPSWGLPMYTMTQFGIGGFTKALGSSSLFQRTGVKIFGFCPGVTDTKLMYNVAPKCINDNFATEFQEEIGHCKLQKPENVANALLEILMEAKPGSLWVVENDQEPYEVELKATVRKRKESLAVE